MRVFGVNNKQRIEYKERSFGDEHVESDLEAWVESNPDIIVEGIGVLIIAPTCHLVWH